MSGPLVYLRTRHATDTDSVGHCLEAAADGQVIVIVLDGDDAGRIARRWPDCPTGCQRH
jgi:hypothetical protein